MNKNPFNRSRRNNATNEKSFKCELYLERVYGYTKKQSEVDWIHYLSESTVYRYKDLMILYVEVIKRFRNYNVSDLYYKMSFGDICKCCSRQGLNHNQLSKLIHNFIDVNICLNEEISKKLASDFNMQTNGELKYLF